MARNTWFIGAGVLVLLFAVPAVATAAPRGAKRPGRASCARQPVEAHEAECGAGGEKALAACHCACVGGSLRGCYGEGSAHLMAGKYKAALAPFRTMCRAGSVLGCVNLSAAHSQLGDHEKALKIIRPYCEAGVPAACVNATWFAVMRGRGELAEALGDKGIAALPKEPALYVNRGHARLLQGNEAGALTDYQRAITLDPDKHAVISSDLDELGEQHVRITEAATRVRAKLGAAESPAPDGPTIMQATGALLETHKDGKQLYVAPDPDAARGPGEPVPSEQHEAWALKVLEDVLADSPKAARGFADMLFMGPALWDRLQESLGDIGTHTSLHIPQPDGTHAKLPARTFLEGEVGKLLKNRHFKLFAKAARAGGARAATAGERALVYSLISFEIAGEPVTIIGDQDLRLAICGSPEAGIGWFELISGWPMQPTVLRGAP